MATSSDEGPPRKRRGAFLPRADLENSSPEDEEDGAGGKPGDRQQKKTNGRTLKGSSATGKKSRSKPPPTGGGEGDKGTNGKDGGRYRVAVKPGRPPAAAARSHGGNGRRRDSLPAAGNANGTVASLLSSRLRHGDGSPALSIHGGGARRRRGSLGGGLLSGAVSGPGVRARSPSPAAGRRQSTPAATSSSSSVGRKTAGSRRRSASPSVRVGSTARVADGRPRSATATDNLRSNASARRSAQLACGDVEFGGNAGSIPAVMSKEAASVANEAPAASSSAATSLPEEGDDLVEFEARSATQFGSPEQTKAAAEADPTPVREARRLTTAFRARGTAPAMASLEEDSPTANLQGSDADGCGGESVDNTDEKSAAESVARLAGRIFSASSGIDPATLKRLARPAPGGPPGAGASAVELRRLLAARDEEAATLRTVLRDVIEGKEELVSGALRIEGRLAEELAGKDEEADAAVGAMRAEIESLEGKLREASESRGEAEERASMLEVRLKEEQDRNSSLEEEMEGICAELDSATRANESHLATVADLEERLRRSESAAVGLRVDAAEATRRGAVAAAEAASRARNEAQSTIDGLREDLRGMQTRVDGLKSRRGELYALLHVDPPADDDEEDEEDIHSSIKHMLERDDARQGSLEDKVDVLEDQIGDVHRELGVSPAEPEAGENESEEYLNAKRALLASKKMVRAAIARLRDDASGRAEAERALEQLAERHERLERDHETALESISTSDKDRSELARSIGSIQRAGEEREAELSRRLDAAEGRAAAAEEEAAGLRGRLSDADRERGRLEDALAAAREACEMHEGVADELRGRVAAAETASAESRGRLTGAEREKESLEDALAASEEAREGLEGTVDELRGLVDEARRESARAAESLGAETRLRAEAEGRLADESAARAAAEARVEDSARGHAEEAGRLRESLEGRAKELEGRLAERDAEVGERDATIASLESRAAALEDDLARQRERMDEDREAEAGRLNATIDELRERLRAEEEGLRTAGLASACKVKELEDIIARGIEERRRMHEIIQELRGNVRVYARIRPFLPGDGLPPGDSTSFVSAGTGSTVHVARPGDPSEHEFKFDRVFDQSAGQDCVYEEVSGLVTSALDGYNVVLFTYGQTGSGKTHTLQGTGTGEMRGMIPRCIEQIATHKSAIEADGWSFRMEASFLEIYQEKIRDLLRVSPDEKTTHEIKVGSDGRRTVTNLAVKALDPTDQEAVDAVLSLAAKRRSTGSTDMNATSSRSHSVFSLELLATSPGGQAVRGRLHLCDLAGSERLDRSNATGVAASETKSINKSLSSLADVFTAIGQRASFVPFRNSKLTYLLQPALSGSGKMCMFVNVSPTEASVQETLCSLRFATKVNKCELGKAMRTVETTASCKTGGATKRVHDAGCGGRPSSSGGRCVKRKAG